MKPIVIEGPDGSGKTTLIEKHFPDAIHRGGPPVTITELAMRIRRIDDDKVYDRWSAISEWVYADIREQGPLIPYGELCDFISHYKPIIIYCCPPIETVLQNVRQQTERHHKSSAHTSQCVINANRIYKRYSFLLGEFAPQAGCTVLRYDYTQEL